MLQAKLSFCVTDARGSAKALASEATTAKPHVIVASAASRLRIQTISAERKFVAAPMDRGLRLSGTVEFAGFAAKPNMRRADILLRHGQAMFPGLDILKVDR